MDFDPLVFVTFFWVEHLLVSNLEAAQSLLCTAVRPGSATVRVSDQTVGASQCSVEEIMRVARPPHHGFSGLVLSPAASEAAQTALFFVANDKLASRRRRPLTTKHNTTHNRVHAARSFRTAIRPHMAGKSQ